MKIELGTEKLREAVSKAYKGAGRMGIKLLTTIIGIEGRKGNLYLTTTDSSSVITVAINGVLPENEEFYTAVNADLFKKIMDKTTSPTVVLSVESNRIVFTGNGDYNLEICMNNEDGTSVPARIIHNQVEGEPQEVSVSDFKKIYTYLRKFVSNHEPQHMMYKIHDGYVLSYDNSSAGLLKTGIVGDMAFSKSFVNLFDTLDGEKARLTVVPKVGKDGNIEGEYLKIESDSVLITGSVVVPSDAGIVKFVDLVSKLCNSDHIFTKNAVIDKSKFIGVLDRISIFVSQDKSDDAYMIDVEIDNKEIVFVTQAKNCVESIKFDECVGSDSIIVNKLSHGHLLDGVSAIPSDKLHVSFSERPGIKIYDEQEKLYIVIPYQIKD